jgi:hypothetical protein
MALKWWLIKVLTLSVIGLGILNYLMEKRTGKDLMETMNYSWPKVSVPNLDTLKEAVPEVHLPSFEGFDREKGRPITVYKWVDENGAITYSQTKPREGVVSELITIDPETNIIPADNLPLPPP